MEQELKKLVNSVKEKMKVQITVSAKSDFNGDLAAMDAAACDPENVFCDTAQNRTCFRFIFKGGEYIGALDGVGETEQNYAFLLSHMLEEYVSKDAGLSRQDFLKSILLGDASAARTHKFMTKFAMADSPCYVLVISSEKHAKEIADLIARGISGGMESVVRMDENSCAIVKYADEEGDLRSGVEYGEFWEQSILEELGVEAFIGVGGVVNNFYDVSASYQQAASAVRMMRLFEGKGKVHSYKEFLLVRMLEDISEVKLREYWEDTVGESAKRIFEDEEMLSTAEEFLNNSLNVSQTSAILYMHRNTLMYRLEKIERGTGLNIRNFSDAVTFRLMSILYKIVKK